MTTKSDKIQKAIGTLPTFQVGASITLGIELGYMLTVGAETKKMAVQKMVDHLADPDNRATFVRALIDYHCSYGRSELGDLVKEEMRNCDIHHVPIEGKPEAFPVDMGSHTHIDIY